MSSTSDMTQSLIFRLYVLTMLLYALYNKHISFNTYIICCHSNHEALSVRKPSTIKFKIEQISHRIWPCAWTNARTGFLKHCFQTLFYPHKDKGLLCCMDFKHPDWERSGVRMKENKWEKEERWGDKDGRTVGPTWRYWNLWMYREKKQESEEMKS